MTPLENHRRSVVDFNRHDANATAHAYAANALVFDPSHDVPLRGRAAVREDYATLFRAFPDIQTEIVDLVVNGNRIAYQLRLTGTHGGPLRSEQGEIEATGRRLDLPAAVFAEANEEGAYTTVRRFYDTLTLFRQLGVTLEPLAQ